MLGKFTFRSLSPAQYKSGGGEEKIKYLPKMQLKSKEVKATLMSTKNCPFRVIVT